MQVRLDDGFVSLFQDTRRKLKKLTGKKLTRAYILREGGRNLLRQLCVQIAKAEQGTLHAKPRTNGAQ